MMKYWNYININIWSLLAATLRQLSPVISFRKNKSGRISDVVKVKVSKSKRLALNSTAFPVGGGRKYYVNIKVQGIEGEKYSAYLAVIMLDSKGKELDRRIRWLNDFSGELVSCSLVVQAPDAASSAVVAYRINTELATPANWTGKITPADELVLEEASPEAAEDFDDITDAIAARAEANMRPLTAAEEQRIEENMVWVFSSARSGSSWLTMKLLNHKDILLWNEPLIGTHLGCVAGRLVSPVTAEYRTPVDRTIDVYAGEPDYFFSSAYKSVWMPYFKRMVLQRLFCQHPESLHKVVVIKEPNGSQSADLISRLFPNSRLIFLLRDGRDIVDSVLDMHKKESWAKKWMELPALDAEMRRSVIINQSNSWSFLMTLLLSAYKNHEQTRRHMVVYEQLRYDTLEKLMGIYNFLGIPVDGKDLRRLVDKSSFEKTPQGEKGSGKVIRKAKPGGWKESFTEEEKRIMNTVMGEKLKELGYEL